MAPSLTPLKLDTLADVKGGLVSAMLDKALSKLAADIENAPDINEWRKVTLEIRARPVCENMELSHVITEFAVKGRVPDRVTSATMLVRSQTNGARQLVFNIDAQDSPNQMSLLGEESE